MTPGLLLGLGKVKMQENENVILSTVLLGVAEESLPSVCPPSAALSSQDMAYLYQLLPVVTLTIVSKP